MMQIVWKKGYCGKGDPVKIYNALEKLRSETGDLEPDDVVKAARNKKSPMHNEFIWDDTEAAHQYRLDQARSLIRSIKVVREEAPHLPPQRAYVSVTKPDKAAPKPQVKKVYTDTAEALTNPVRRAEILSKAIREALAYRKKYAELSELAGVFRAIDDLLAGFGE